MRLRLVALLPLGALALPSPRRPHHDLQTRGLLHVPASPFGQANGATHGKLVDVVAKGDGASHEPPPQNPYARPQPHRGGGTSILSSPFEQGPGPHAHGTSEDAPVAAHPSRSGEKRKHGAPPAPESAPIAIPGRGADDDTHRQRLEHTRRVIRQKKAAGQLRRKPPKEQPKEQPATAPIPIAAPHPRPNVVVGRPPRQQQWPLLYHGLERDARPPSSPPPYVPPPHLNVYLRRRDLGGRSMPAGEELSRDRADTDDGDGDGPGRSAARPVDDADGADVPATTNQHGKLRRRMVGSEPGIASILERLKQRTAAWERQAFRNDARYRAARAHVDRLHADAVNAALPLNRREFAYRGLVMRIDWLRNELARDRAQWEGSLNAQAMQRLEHHPVLGQEVRKATATIRVLVRECERHATELAAMKEAAKPPKGPEAAGEKRSRPEAAGQHPDGERRLRITSEASNVPQGHGQGRPRPDAAGQHPEGEHRPRSSGESSDSPPSHRVQKRNVSPQVSGEAYQVLPRIEAPLHRGLQKQPGPSGHAQPPKRQGGVSLAVQRTLLEALTAGWTAQERARKEQTHLKMVRLRKLKDQINHQVQIHLPEKMQFQTFKVLQKQAVQLQQRTKAELQTEGQRKQILNDRMHRYPALAAECRRAKEAIDKRVTEKQETLRAISDMKQEGTPKGPRLKTIPEKTLDRQKALPPHPERSLHRRAHDEDAPKEIEMKEMKPSSHSGSAHDSGEAAMREQRQHAHGVHEQDIRRSPDLEQHGKEAHQTFEPLGVHSLKMLTIPPERHVMNLERGPDTKAQHGRKEEITGEDSAQLGRIEKPGMQELTEKKGKLHHVGGQQSAKHGAEGSPSKQLLSSHRLKKLSHPLEDLEPLKAHSPRILRRDRILRHEAHPSTLRDSYISDVGTSAGHARAEHEKFSARLEEAEALAKHERLAMPKEARKQSRTGSAALHKRQTWSEREAAFSRKMEESEDTSPAHEQRLHEFHRSDRPQDPRLHREDLKHSQWLKLKGLRTKLGMEHRQEHEHGGAKRLERDERPKAEGKPPKSSTDSRRRPHEVDADESTRLQKDASDRMRAAKHSASSLNRHYEQENGARGRGLSHDGLERQGSSVHHRRSPLNDSPAPMLPQPKKLASFKLHLFPQYSSKPLEVHPALEQSTEKHTIRDVGPKSY